MTAWVADYTTRIPATALKAAGVTGVVRYVSRYPWKVLTAAEYGELKRGGLVVMLNFEDDAHDWLSGGMGGAADGTFAASAARTLGYPVGSVIAGSADFDMSAAQWSTSGQAYATAFSHALAKGGYRAGVYGPYDVLGWCEKLGGFDVFWQSMSTAFSQGRNARPWPGGHLWQRRQITMGGVQVDVNDIRQPDWSGAMALEEIVPATGGRNAGVALSDLWNEEMVEHSGYVPADRSARTARLMRIETNTSQILTAVKAGQPVTLSGPVTLSDESVQALAAALATHIKVQ